MSVGFLLFSVQDPDDHEEMSLGGEGGSRALSDNQEWPPTFLSWPQKGHVPCPLLGIAGCPLICSISPSFRPA